MKNLQNVECGFVKLSILNDRRFVRIFAAILVLSFGALLGFLTPSFAVEDFILRTSQQVYMPGDELIVYGAATPNELMVVRLSDPSGLAIRIDSVTVDEDGFFRKGILDWPSPTRAMPFGTYTVEVISGVAGRDPQLVEIAFAEGIAAEAPVIQFPKTRDLGVKLDSPSEVTVGTDFRIFVQVTFDNALVDAEDQNAVVAILGSSHIHSDNSTIILSDKFIKLHPGLYFADVRIVNEGAYIIHAAAFYKGFLSHDSRVVTASASSIGTLQQSVDQLSTELDRLQTGLDETQSALNETKATITNSADEIGLQIDETQQASSQINSLILPLLALISVIIALQISLFARIRASYR